jgi:hypothetical protein
MGAMGAAADADGAARDDGVIGALVCAHTGAASTSAAARAVPLKRCFMTIDPPGESHRVCGKLEEGLPSAISSIPSLLRGCIYTTPR